MGEIGATVCVIDVEKTYTKRSFCILESYSSVAHKSKFAVHFNSSDNAYCRNKGNVECLNRLQRFSCWPCGAFEVKTEAATARRQKDQEMIDKFIRDGDGYDKV